MDPFSDFFANLHKEADDYYGKIRTNEYKTILGLEKLTFGRENAFLIWTKKYWTFSIWLAVFYCLFVLYARRYMRDRVPFRAQLPLVLWSGSLAAFSILATLRSLPELFAVWRQHGLEASLCHPCYYYGVPGFWSILFISSKVWELGDTAFIVLRKQPLILLHWYHHASVLVYVWYSYTDHTAPGRWFYCLNYFVHSFMYSYYTLRAMRIRLPRVVNMSITALQIAQMVAGLSIYVYIYMRRRAEPAFYCQISSENMFWGFSMYLSYFFLFAHFFVKTYILEGGSGGRSSAEMQAAAIAKSASAAAVSYGNGHASSSGRVSERNGIANGIKRD